MEIPADNLAGHLESASATNAEILHLFSKLPALYNGKQVTIEFAVKDFDRAWEGECETLGLKIGATVRSLVTLATGQLMCVYAENELAVTLLRLPAKTVVRAEAVTAFGLATDVEWGEDGPIETRRIKQGLVIKRILQTEEDRPAGS